jgi:hypothetical protein
VRRATVAEYEQAAAAAGLEVERVHLAPLVALAGLMRVGGAGDAVHAVLGDVAMCLAAFRDGLPVAVRSRRRDRSSGEGSRLRREASRAAALTGDGSEAARLVVSGSEAVRLRHELGESPGPGPVGGGESLEAAEPPSWLGGLVS